MAYGQYNGSTYLYCFSEWFYSSTGSGSYQWSPGAVSFDMVISKYSTYDPAHPENNVLVSTTNVTHTCGTGEWAVQQWNSTTVRVSGGKYIQLSEGFTYVITLNPKCHGSFRASYYSQWGPVDWTGQQQNGIVDLTWPGDG
jgi:hypothetical protein